jgi:hypothetical protein
MKFLRIPLAAALAVSLLSGCGSSSTTAPAPGGNSGSGRSENKHDDRARELIVQLGKLSDNDRAQKGREIGMELLAIKSLLSEPLRTDVETLLNETVMTVVAAHEAESSRTAVGRATREEFEEQNQPTTIATVREADSRPTASAPSARVPIELLPEPREAK